MYLSIRLACDRVLCVRAKRTHYRFYYALEVKSRQHNVLRNQRFEPKSMMIFDSFCFRFNIIIDCDIVY